MVITKWLASNYHEQKTTSKANFHKGGLFELSVYSMNMSLYWYPYVWTDSSLHLFNLHLEALKQSHGTTTVTVPSHLSFIPSIPYLLTSKKKFF